MTCPLVEEAGRVVAQVAVDATLAHLDRTFDYAVPEQLKDQIVPGCRVKVRFAGQMLDGWVLGLSDSTEYPGELDQIRKVVSSEPVLTPETIRLIRTVADHYAGVWWEVARLAIPSRVAAVEQAKQRAWPDPTLEKSEQTLSGYPNGAGYLKALRRGDSPRAIWQAAPTFSAEDMVSGALEASSACLSSGRGVIVLVPTKRELERALPRFQERFGTTSVAIFSLEQGRAARYRNYLAMSRGEARIVIGTRSTVFAPIKQPGLIIVLDEGSDHYAEKRAPFYHSRTVAVLRAAQQRAGVLFASHSRSVDAQSLLEKGWLKEISLSPTELRRRIAPVRTVSELNSRQDSISARLRIPSAAFQFLRAMLPTGPVLVQVPNRGLSAALSCARCHNLARCIKCQSLLRSLRSAEPECSMCGYHPVRWECQECHHNKLRNRLPGAVRTAEELARAFPGVLAVNSSDDRIRDEVPAESAIVVSTPGAEPHAVGGYAAALFLDAEVALSRADFKAAEEAMRRWSNALSLVRPAEQGGSALIVGAHLHPAVQALARADSPGFIARELELRRTALLPPAVRTARVEGELAPIRDFLANVDWEPAEVLGPTEIGGQRWAALLRATPKSGLDLVSKVKTSAALRSSKKQGGVLYWQVDPEVIS